MHEPLPNDLTTVPVNRASAALPSAQGTHLPPFKTRREPPSDQVLTGIPVLVEPGGNGHALARVPLTPGNHGDFDEAWLQRLIHENPECLPLAELEPGLDRFSAICREIQTTRGFVDNLLMTGRGDIAIIETKLFRNPEARRKVIAQVLDYATSLFAMSYVDFEKAVLTGIFSPHAKPAYLYDALPEAGKLSEAAFVDAVTHNLRRGRALLLVAGDGIRGEAENLLEGLQAHARLGFTLALIELAVFRMPEPGRFLIRPRTLAKTAITQRTIVEINGSGVVSAREERLVVPETLSEAAYWHALEEKVPGAHAALAKFIRAAEPLRVYPEFQKSLNLRWDRPGSKSVNLGYIQRNGSIWTDAASWSAPKELALRYVEDLSTAFECGAHAMPSGAGWTPYMNGKALRLGLVLDHLDAWLGPMQRFITAIVEHDAQGG